MVGNRLVGITIVFVFAIISTIGLGQNAFADNIIGNLGSATVVTEQSVTVSYKLQETSANQGDPLDGCNVSAASPATVTINVPPGIDAVPPTLLFDHCSTNERQSVVITPHIAGVFTITVSVSGGLGGEYQTQPATTVLTVTDGTPPVITPNVVGTPGLAGWYVSDVIVSWTVTDAESAISSQTGCETTTISTDTSGTTFTCTATSAGGTSSNSVTIKRDATPPEITLLGANPLYLQDNGAVYSDPGATAFDATSGAGSIEVDASAVNTSFPEVYIVTYNVQDEAGNSAVQVERTVDVVNVSLDATKYNIDDGAIVTIVDFLAYRDPNIVTISATISSLIPNDGTRDTESILLSRSGQEGFFTNEETVNFVTNPADTALPPPLLAVSADDDVLATYLGFDSATARIIDPATGGFLGVPPRSTDIVRFFESDRYTLAQSAQIKVNDPAAAGAGTVTVHVSSTTDPTGIDMTLTEDVTLGQFTSFPSLTFSSVGPSDDAAELIQVTIGDTVTADYNGNTATATIVESDDIAFVSGYVPDIAVRSTCIGDTDNDVDGICDSWEDQLAHAGVLRIPATISGVQYELTCDPAATSATDSLGTTVCPSTSRKDLYVEFDYMTGHAPITAALTNVATALGAAPVRGLPAAAPNGVQVHFFVDEELGHQTLLKFQSADPVETTFLTLKQVHFGTPSDRIAPAELPGGVLDDVDFVQKLLTAKRQIFHYGLFAHEQQEEPDSSGLGERPGNDFLITLGAFTAHVGTQGQQAGTLLHELGHNLGLKHGGSDDTNCKGNYLSVMNYLFQFDTSDGGFVAGRPLTISSYKYSTINENGLREDVNSITGTSRATIIGGIVGGTPFTPTPVTTNTKIDWNRNGLGVSPGGNGPYVQNTRYFSDVLDCHETGTVSVVGFNDAANLVFNFRGQSTFDTGVFTINQIHLTTTTAGTPDPDSIAPGVDAVTDFTINEGDEITGTGSIKDPDNDGLSGTIDFGDGVTEALSITPVPEVGGTFSYGPHLYPQDGSFNLAVSIETGRGGSNTDTAVLTVLNVAPTVNAGSDATINEGSTFSSSGSFSDPGADPWTATVDYGDGSGPQSLALNPDKTFSLNHPYVDNCACTVTVTVNDDDTSGSDTALVTVLNVAPTVNAGSDATISSGTMVSFSGSFTDAGSGDTHTILWNFGDGTTASGTLTPTHKYISIGAYTVTLSVTDDDGASATDSLVLTVNPVAVIIDVNPANSENGLKLNDQGNTQVAMFSSADVDATKVNTSTVKLKAVNGVSSTCTGGATVTRSDNSKDLNGDGKKDILMVFKTNQICHTINTNLVELTGSLADPDSRQFRGTDTVRVS